MLIVWSARILISIFQDSVTQILENEHGQKMSETEPSEKKRSFRFDDGLFYTSKGGMCAAPNKTNSSASKTDGTRRLLILSTLGNKVGSASWWFFLGFGESHEVGPYQLEMDEMGLYLL